MLLTPLHIAFMRRRLQIESHKTTSWSANTICRREHLRSGQRFKTMVGWCDGKQSNKRKRAHYIVFVLSQGTKGVDLPLYPKSWVRARHDPLSLPVQSSTSLLLFIPFFYWSGFLLLLLLWLLLGIYTLLCRLRLLLLQTNSITSNKHCQTTCQHILHVQELHLASSQCALWVTAL